MDQHAQHGPAGADVVSEYFTAPDDETAASTLQSGPGARTHVRTRLDPLVALAQLRCALTGETLLAVIEDSEHARGVGGGGDETGRLVVGVAPATLEALQSTSGPELQEAAGRAGTDPTEARAVADLARRRGEEAVYCWIQA